MDECSIAVACFVDSWILVVEVEVVSDDFSDRWVGSAVYAESVEQWMVYCGPVMVMLV